MPKRVEHKALNWALVVSSSHIISNVRACCFLRVLGSTCSLAVGTAQTHASDGLLRRFHRASRVIPTRGVIGSILRAAAVLPCVTKSAPCRPVAGGSPLLTRRASRASSDAPRTQANAAGQD